MKPTHRSKPYAGKKSGGWKGEGKSFGDKKPWERRSTGKGFSGGKPGLHSAICKACGKDCVVPFKPTGVRPVFCSACFDKNDRSAAPRSFRSERTNDRAPEHRDTDQVSAQLKAVNQKLDAILKMLTDAM